MSASSSRYRIYATPYELTDLPDLVTVEVEYPAFSLITGPDDAIADLRERFPVEEMAAPKPPPQLPQAAGMAAAVDQGPQRGPYTRVVRFRQPVREEWLDAIDAAGSQLLGFLGSNTVVVSCPNKPTLIALNGVPKVERISAYVPDIRVDPSFLAALQLPGQPAVGGPPPGVRGGTATAPGQLIATFFIHDDQQLALRSFRRQGMRGIVEAGDKALIINLGNSTTPFEDLRVIATRHGLRSLEEKRIRRVYNNVARQAIGGRVVTSPDLKLTGRGEIVAVADSGLDTGDAATIHADFQGRIKDIQSFPIAPSWAVYVDNPDDDDGPSDKYTGHGTHCAGSVLGNGAKSHDLADGPIAGMALEAELVFQSVEQTAEWKRAYAFQQWTRTGREPERNGLFGLPDNLADLFLAAYEQGARIHSNSWGGGFGGEYDLLCEQVDRFVWDHRDFLVVVAAGNEGRGGLFDGAFVIEPGSVSSPGTAKNCLTVGACENERVAEFIVKYGKRWIEKFGVAPFLDDGMADSVDDIAAFSGRGPCDTGRRKPDVVAPGTFVLSTRSSQIAPNNFAWGSFPEAKQDYMFMCGTSMATPLVSGGAALVRQYLRETEGIATPSAALVKAILIHAAQYRPYRFAHPQSSQFADNEQGWGRVDLSQILTPATPANVVFIDATEGLPANHQHEFTINVVDASAPLRITLVYTDYPGRDLINNLNVFAFDPNGGYTIGNDFARAGVTDSDNNVEGIIVSEPTPGEWRIRVVASNVPQGPQDYALVISVAGASRN